MPSLNSKIDIVLVNPPALSDEEFGMLSGAGCFRPPLNLLNLSAALLGGDYSVQIVDGVVLENFENVLKTIVSLRPRYIGITSMTAHIHACGRLAEALKEMMPDTLIILGGIHISTLPEETMRIFPAFDIGVVGEGDRTIVNLLDKLENKEDLSLVPGLALRSKGDVFLTPPVQLVDDLDALPFPAWHLLAGYVTAYQPTTSRRTRLPSAYLVTSRGCPFNCSFCSNTVFGRTFRSYSVDYIMKMISVLSNDYKIKDLTIYDENLALERKRMVELCNRLIDAEGDLTWSCDARVDCVDDETLSLMYAAGCRSIWFGMESGNQNILDRYNKKITLKDCDRAVMLCRRNNIKATGSFIIGGPGETAETIKDTIRFAKRSQLDYFVPIFYTPIPGTFDYAKIRDYGTCDLNYYSATMTRPTFAPYGMSVKDVYFWYIFSLLSFYSQPKILSRELKLIGLKKVLIIGFKIILNLLKYFFKKVNNF